MSWWWRVLGALLAMVAVIAGGLSVQPNDVRTIPAPLPPPPPAPPPPPPPPGPPVLAVKVDNAPEARPPTGIGAADVIYVEPVEAGISRVIAIFGSHQPPVVGPVRSARQTDLRLLPQYGHPTLAYSGAAPELLPEIASAPVNNAAQPLLPGAYYRGPGVLPHNLFVRTDALPLGAGWSPAAFLRFGPLPAGREGIVPWVQQDVAYQRAKVGFTWSPPDQRWLVSMDGVPYAATDSARLSASTVVLQEVPIFSSPFRDVAGSISPFADTVGGGRAVILRDGMAIDATWSRPAPEAGTSYTTRAGEQVLFAPGQVWIVLVPKP